MKKIVSILFLIFITSGVFSAEKVVLYPNINGLGEKSFGYQLLNLVMKKTGKAYKVKLRPETMNQDRALNELEAGNLSVVDVGFLPDGGSKYEVVNIPIDRGLLGWRIFIININEKKEFARIKTLKELKTKIAGQGIGWTDGAIIENAGIKVMTSAKIENLIGMVDSGRFDFFPLGVNEAHGFLREYGKEKPNLIIEDTLVLKYPFARLYYVKKGNKELCADIKLGLENAYKDGSFQNFIENHPFFKEGLSKSNLKNRTVIKIDNPFINDEFKKIDPKWWYDIK